MKMSKSMHRGSVLFITTVMAVMLETKGARAATAYWDSDATGTGNVIAGTGLGGAGNWNNSLSGTPLLNWWSGSGSTDQTWVNANNDTAVFTGSTAGTVTLTDSITVGGLVFNTTGYTIDTGVNTLTLAPASTITLNNVAAATITGAVTGTGAVTITRTSSTAGTLTLNGTSTGGWSGATTISNGATLALSQGNQALLNTSSIALGGSITLTNTSLAEAGLNRVSDTAAITSTGGTFTVTNTVAAATPYSETIGAVGLTSGALNIVSTNANIGGTQVLTLANLTQAGSSTVAFSAGGGLNTTTNRINVAGASGATTTGEIIGPWATVGTAATAQTDYAVFDSSNNVVAANIAASAENLWASGATAVNTLSGASTLTAGRSMNALRYTGSAQTLALNGFNLDTNGILNGGSGLLTISGTGNIRQQGTAAGNLYINTGSNNVTVSSVIANNTGALTLVKTGTGTLTLSGVNTYTGQTIVQAGTLTPSSSTDFNGDIFVGSLGGGPAASFGASNINVRIKQGVNVTVYSNGTFGWGNVGLGHVGNLTVIGGTVNSGFGYVDGTITMTGGTITGSLAGSSATVNTNASASTAVINNIGTAANITFNVADGIAPIDLQVNTGPNYQYGNIIKTGSGVMALGSSSFPGTTTISAGTLLLTGSGALTNSTLANGGTGIVFDSSVSSHAFTVGGLNGSGNLALQDNAATPNAVALTLNVVAGGSRTYSGNLSGAGSVTKTLNTLFSATGVSTQILSGTNTYTGTTTINAGILQFAKPASLYNSNTTSWTPDNIIVASGATLAINVGSGGTTDFGSTASQSNFTTLLGNLAASTASTGLKNGSALGIDTTNANFSTSTVIANTNSGANAIGLTKLGTNTLTLGGTNTYTGPTTISAGTLSVGTSANLGDSASNLIFDGGTLQISGNTLTNFSGIGHTVAFNATKTVGLDVNSATNTFTVDQVLNQTTGGFTKSGTGTAILNQANTYTGTTTVNAGTLVLDQTGAGALAATSALTLGGGNFQIKGAAAGSAQTVAGFALTANTNNSIILDPNNGTGVTLTLGNAWTRGAGSSLLFDYSSANTGTRTVVTAGATTGAALSNGIYGWGLVKDSLGVTGFATRDGSGNISRFDDTTGTTLDATSNTAATNFTTLNTVYSTGTLTWTGGGLTNRSVNSLTIDTTNNGGTVDMGAAGNILTLTSQGILFKGSNNEILTGGQVGAAASEVIVHQTGAGLFTINSKISSGAGSLTKDGTGTLVLGAANAYTGATNVNGGILRAGVATSAFGSSAPVILANISGAALDLNNFSETIGILAGGGASGGNVTLGSGTLTVNSGSNGTYAGVISGTGGFTKTGSGTQTLSGTNTYTGVATLTTGTLSVGTIGDGGVAGNLGQATNSAANIVFNGGTLQYTGSTATSNRAFTINAAKTATIDTANNLTLVGATGTATNGALTKIGVGTLTLTGANTNTGLTTVTGGALNIGSSGSLASSATLSIGASATANFANAGQTLGAVTNANTATDALNFSASTGTITLASLSGSGNTRFGSAGTVTGGISTGTVNAVGLLTSAISGGTVSAGSLTGAVSGGAVTITGLATGNVSGSGTLSTGSLSSSSVTGGTNTITGAAGITTLNGGTTTVGGVATVGTATSGTANFNGVTSSITTFNGGTINLGGSTVLTISGGSSAGTINGAGSLIKSSGSTLTLSGANTYSGGTAVNGGTLVYASSFAMSGANSISVAATGVAGTNYATVTSTAGALTFGGTLGINLTASLSGGESFNLFTATTGALLGDFGTTTGNVSVTGTYVASLANNGSGIWTGTDTNGSGLNFTFATSGINAGILSVSAVPEPATYAAIFGGLALAGAVLRRRRMVRG